MDGRITLHKEGYASASWNYNDRCYVTEISYLGAGKEPAYHKDGFAKFTKSYDERGNVAEYAYYDVNGKLAPRKEGQARQREHSAVDNAVRQ